MIALARLPLADAQQRPGGTLRVAGKEGAAGVGFARSRAWRRLGRHRRPARCRRADALGCPRPGGS
jgi:hypothetical protein